MSQSAPSSSPPPSPVSSAVSEPYPPVISSQRMNFNAVTTADAAGGTRRGPAQRSSAMYGTSPPSPTVDRQSPVKGRVRRKTAGKAWGVEEEEEDFDAGSPSRPSGNTTRYERHGLRQLIADLIKSTKHRQWLTGLAGAFNKRNNAELLPVRPRTCVLVF